jgi:hypothetical protein
MATPVVGRLAQPLRTGFPVDNMLIAPTWVDVVSLSSGTPANYTLPASCTFFRLTPTVIPTYGNFNGNAAVPSGTVTNGSASFPVGGQTLLVAPNTADTLSLICASSCYVTIEAWG